VLVLMTMVLAVHASGCEDIHDKCKSWAAAGECSINPGYMGANCKQSCELCPGQNGAAARLAEEAEADAVAAIARDVVATGRPYNDVHSLFQYSVYRIHHLHKSRQEVTIGEVCANTRVQLVVNTASGCSFTQQYHGLESLHKEFAGDDGLCVVGVPSNEFNQEPLTDGVLHKQVQREYSVSFPLLGRIDNLNDHGNLDAHPLFGFLRNFGKGTVEPAPWHKLEQPDRDVNWNFNKWLCVDGIPIKRYGYDTLPNQLRPTLKAIFAALAATTTSTTTTAHQGHYNDADL